MNYGRGRSMWARRSMLLLVAVVLCNGGSVGLGYGASRVAAWGAGTFVSSPPDYNNYGQSIVPASGTNAAWVAAGWRHSLALNADRTLTPWGDDTLGQTDLDLTATNWVAVACGREHSVAL